VDVTRTLFLARLRNGWEADILEPVGGPGGSPARVYLYQAVPKGKNMDLVIEKATELGADGIAPLITGRSVARPAGEGGKVERWRRLAVAAARQSLQLRVPEVREPAPFAEVLEETGEDGVLLHNKDGLPALEAVIAGREVSLFVGPEGGWSDAEVTAARRAGMMVAQLGPYRLRSETAGIVAVARARAALERHAEETLERSGGRE
jgi:16S rRNA (uracil1498-N3)-methyltransferase